MTDGGTTSSTGADLADHIDNNLLDAVVEMYATTESDEKIEYVDGLEKHDVILGNFPSKEEVVNVLNHLFEEIYPGFEKNEERLKNILNAYEEFAKTQEFHSCEQLLADIARHPNSTLINKIVCDCKYDIRWQFVQQVHKAFVTICQNHSAVVVGNVDNNEEEVNGEIKESSAEIDDSDDDNEEESSIQKIMEVNCKTFVDIIVPSVINQWNAEHEDTPSAILDIKKFKEHGSLMMVGGYIVTFPQNEFYQWVLVPSGFLGTKHQSNQILRRFRDFFDCDEFETDSEVKERISNTCWMRTSIKNFSVDENFETSTGNSNVTLVVILYWIPRKKQLKSKMDRQTNEWKNPWWPKLDFPNSSSAVNGDIDDNTKKEYKVSVEKMPFDQFFALLENGGKGRVRSENNVDDEDDEDDDDDDDDEDEPEAEPGWRMENNAEKFFRSGITSEYVYYKETEYELVIGEPFELKAFPFDYQDLPIKIKPGNFKYLAPAIVDRSHSLSNHDSKAIPTVFAGTQITNLGNWNVRHIISEFESMRGSCNILVKMERNWNPFVVKYSIIFGFVTALSFTVFSIDDTAVSEKVGTVLGLILTLIFVDLPQIPIPTMVDKYFYICFAFLVIIASESAFSDNEFMIGSKSSILLGFALLFVAVHLVFVAGIIFTLYLERRKGEMTSSEITELNERGLKEVQVFGDERPIDMCSRTNAVLIGKAIPMGNNSAEEREKFVEHFRGLAFIPMGLNIICLQFPIGLIQLIANTDFGCTFNSSPFKSADAEINTDVVVFLCSASISFMILLFVYIAVGITERHMNVFLAVFVLIMNINLVLSIEFFAYWSNAYGLSNKTFVDCDISEDSEKSLHLLQWWLLLISIISATISLSWTLLTDALTAIIEHDGKGWVLGNITLIVYHFIVFAVSVLQWTSIKLMENVDDHSVNVDNDILPISVLETLLGLLLPQLVMTVNWWMGRVAILNLGWDYIWYSKFTSIAEIGISLLQMCIAIHSLVFWVALDDYALHNISEGRRSALIAIFVVFLIAVVPEICAQRFFAVAAMKMRKDAEKNKERDAGAVEN